jgi:hypothetical protein
LILLARAENLFIQQKRAPNAFGAYAPGLHSNKSLWHVHIPQFATFKDSGYKIKIARDLIFGLE